MVVAQVYTPYLRTGMTVLSKILIFEFNFNLLFQIVIFAQNASQPLARLIFSSFSDLSVNHIFVDSSQVKISPPKLISSRSLIFSTTKISDTWQPYFILFLFRLAYLKCSCSQYPRLFYPSTSSLNPSDAKNGE